MPTQNVREKFRWLKRIKIFQNKRKRRDRQQQQETTQDWRSLSPHDPPLPFLHSPTRNPGSAPSSSIKSSEVNRMTSELAPIFKEFKTSLSLPLHHRHLIPTSLRDLYTIQESSEPSTSYTNTNSTISNEYNPNNTNNNINRTASPVTHSSQMSTTIRTINNLNDAAAMDTVSLDDYKTAQTTWSTLPSFKNPSLVNISHYDSTSTEDESNDLSITEDIAGGGSSSLPTANISNHKMILVEDDDDDDDDEEEEEEEVFYTPIFDWPLEVKHSEPQFSTSLIGNEANCKLRFCKMLMLAYQQYRKGRGTCPKEMFLLFDPMDNVRGITFILKNGSREDYLEFRGSLQYIAPELSISPVFNYEQSDIWALGISLYRMLVGRFPFSVDEDTYSHRDLFKKMFKSDFVIPRTLSDDARDLLQRMLSPENGRASYDLVMFHPWLQPYADWSDIVMENRQKEAEQAATEKHIYQASKKKKSKTKKRMKKAACVIRRMIRIIVKGPYPPPASYYDLVNERYKKR